MSTPHSSDNGAAADLAAASNTSATTIKGPVFPLEVHSLIVGFASHHREASLSSSTRSAATVFPEIHSTEAFTRTDRPTMLNLLTVSRSFYYITTPLLYRNVLLSRPSALDCFLRTLSSHPQLCEHVKSLQVGDSILSQGSVSPIIPRPSIMQSTMQRLLGNLGKDIPENAFPPAWYLASSLRSTEEAALLPDWCYPGQEIAVAAPSSQGPRSMAVFKAVRAIQRFLDVDLTRKKARMYCPEGSYSTAEWTVLVYEAQAALDLYLMAIRRWEMVDYCSIFPSLVITGYKASPPSEDVYNVKHDTPLPFVITRADILHHLARPHSPVDRYDHPVHFAREGINIMHGPEPTDAAGNERNADFWSSLFSPDKVDPTLPPTTNMASMVHLLRTLLLRLRNLEVLRVTSFLERAVCCGSHLPVPAKLHALLIGPVPVNWSPPLRFGSGAFPALKRLHLCCDLPQAGEVESVVENLRGLETLSWDVQGKMGRGDASR